jgi:hypothetical protein
MPGGVGLRVMSVHRYLQRVCQGGDDTLGTVEQGLMRGQAWQMIGKGARRAALARLRCTSRGSIEGVVQ